MLAVGASLLLGRRHKLERAPSEPRYVVAVPGVGYMLRP